MLHCKKTLLALSAAAAVSMTGMAQAADDVSLRMHWLVNGSTLAWYLGKERGYFDEAGINLTINEGRGSVVATQVVGSGAEQFGTADGMSVIQSMSKGMPIKAVMTLQDVGALGVVYLKESGIEKLEDLKGKTLALTAGDSLTQQWPVVAEANGLTEDSVSLVYMDAAAKPVSLMNKQVDAMLGTCIDHVLLVESNGHEAGCLRFSDLGVATVGITVLTNDTMLEKNPDLVQRFVDAAIRSYEAYYEDPEAALDAAIKSLPDINRNVLAAQAGLIKQFYGERPIGHFVPEDWKATVETMKLTGVLESDLPYDAYYRSEFVNK